MYWEQVKELNSVKLYLKDLVNIQASDGVYVGGPLCWLENIHVDKTCRVMQDIWSPGGVRES